MKRILMTLIFLLIPSIAFAFVNWGFNYNWSWINSNSIDYYVADGDGYYLVSGTDKYIVAP